MITNFETHTEELSIDELKLVPTFVRAFTKYTKDNPIKAPQIVERFNANTTGKKLSEPKLRKIVNHIRSYGLLPLMSTSHGYFVSDEINDIKSQIKSLEERARSIQRCADGLKKLINQ